MKVSVKLRYLQHRLPECLQGWHGCIVFVLGLVFIILSFKILLLPIISLMFLDLRNVSIPGFANMSYRLGFSFRMSQCLWIISLIGGRVELNVVMKGIRSVLFLSCLVNFRVYISYINIYIYIYIYT